MNPNIPATRSPAASRALACAWLCALLTAPMAEAQDWPRVPLPKELQVFDIGQQVTLNGSPMRLQGFVSPIAPDALAELFRQSLGRPLVENTLGKQRILGRAQGDYYISVQIEAAGQGSRGITAVTNLKAAHASREQTGSQGDRWRSALLSGSRLLSLMDSQDGRRLSRHMVFANTYSENMNADRLKSMLQEEGLKFEREGSGDAAVGVPESLGASKALFFKGRDKEALATIHRDNNGQTTVVLNVVTQEGNFK